MTHHEHDPATPDYRAELHRHHGGAEFRELMETTFAGRFDDRFWELWGEWIDPILGDPPAMVDLGTGPGLMLEVWRERYPDARLAGVEIMPYMVEAARERAATVRAELVVADFHEPPLDLPTGAFDAALCSMVLHELQEPVSLLAEVRRILRPGGRLFLIDWIRVPLLRYLAHRGAEHVLDPERSTPEERRAHFQHFTEHARYTREDLRDLCAHFGLQPLWEDVYAEGIHWRAVLERL